MTGLLAGITGQFPRRLVFGTLLPAIIFVLAVQIVIEPLIPERWGVADTLATLEPRWQLALWTFVTVVVTSLLYILNIPLIRLYEGYPWSEESWVGRWMIRRQRRKLKALCTEEFFFGYLVRELASLQPDHPRLARLDSRRDEATRARINRFPKWESLLPTDLGNVMRAFENYPDRQYRMSGITLWPRLASLLTAEQANAIDAAKMPFDFMVNSSALATVLAAVSLATAVLAPFDPGDGPGREILGAAACAVLGYAFYRGSIGRAEAWGNEVKAAFDLRRRALLKGLGFEQKPTTLSVERDLWREITTQLVFLDHWAGDAADLSFRAKGPQTLPKVRAASDRADLRVARGLVPIGAWHPRALSANHRRVAVIVEIQNRGVTDAKEIEVTDRPPEGWDYIWGSATLDGQTIAPRGSSPLVFNAGDVPVNTRKELRYEAVFVDQPPKGDAK